MQMANNQVFDIVIKSMLINCFAKGLALPQTFIELVDKPAT